MKSMKLRSLLGATAVTALLLTGGSVQAQIANTKHNLGSTSGATNNRATNVQDLCVFCHTPHGSDTSASVPLWNRALDGTPGTTYTTYDQLGTSTLDCQVLAVGSVSLACLSCHDGTQALDSVINAPGSGGFTAGGARIANSGLQGGTVDAATGRLQAGVITNLGTDLQDDHPVGIQYGGFTPTGATAQIDADFVVPATATRTLADGTTTNIWWVDTDGVADGQGGTLGGTAAREKQDMQLYTRLNGAAEQPFVECASCHDPHIDRTTFLRIDNTGSAVCLACHTK